jgi:L-ascorbate metabolism protein UlaG (beta-lactamase superfamily)
MPISITLIGGPTALIEIDGFRLLTDPTFDAPGAYQLPHVTMRSCSATTSTPTISTIPAARFSNTQSAC